MKKSTYDTIVNKAHAAHQNRIWAINVLSIGDDKRTAAEAYSRAAAMEHKRAYDATCGGTVFCNG